LPSCGAKGGCICPISSYFYSTPNFCSLAFLLERYTLSPAVLTKNAGVEINRCSCLQLSEGPRIINSITNTCHKRGDKQGQYQRNDLSDTKNVKMSHAIRQDLSKLSKIIVICLKNPSRGIHQSNEIINNP